MHPTYSSEVSERRVRLFSAAQVVSLVGPVTVAGGVVWAILQPWRLTLLHPLHRASGGSWSSRRCS